MTNQVQALRAIHRILTHTGESVATAESLTAGMIAATLASQSGSSAYLRGGMVVYTLDTKVSLLDVDREGARVCNCVSQDVASQMAQGLRKKLQVDCGIAVTGYAEPYGGKGPYAYYEVFYRDHVERGCLQGGLRSRNEMRRWVTASALCVLANLLRVVNAAE